MIFAFVEDGTIVVYEDEAAARKEWPPIDVESSVVVFYGEDGTWLKPVFIAPNRTRLFGLIRIQGDYRLARCKVIPPEIDSIEIALDEASGVRRNAHFDSVEAVRVHIRERRAR
jgi:hypothetical protein